MTEPYIYAVWIVKAGREDEFVEGWRELSEWTSANAPGAGIDRLFQDEDQPGRFVSMRSWADRNAIAVWRSQLGYQERVGRLRELLETFTPAHFRLRSEVAGAELPAERSAWADHMGKPHGRP